VFTIWMKSLVLNGSGCTVYDSGGRIVYRVDNYGSRRAADVCLMDLAGNVVVQILSKARLGHLVGRWDGYRPCRGGGARAGGAPDPGGGRRQEARARHGRRGLPRPGGGSQGRQRAGRGAPLTRADQEDDPEEQRSKQEQRQASQDQFNTEAGAGVRRSGSRGRRRGQLNAIVDAVARGGKEANETGKR
jgi:hypothetical protein